MKTEEELEKEQAGMNKKIKVMLKEEGAESGRK
jgi:hypothetical protein